MTILLGCVCALLAVLVLVVWLLAGRRGADGLLAERLREEFVVTLIDGTAFRGLLLDADDKTVVLTAAATVPPPQQAAVPIDGELVLPRSKVAYMQRLG